MKQHAATSLRMTMARGRGSVGGPGTRAGWYAQNDDVFEGAMAFFENRVWLVLDSVGIGALPDADQYGDAGRNTLGHIRAVPRRLAIPNLVRLGFANIEPLANLSPVTAKPSGLFWKRRDAFAGQGHHDGSLGNGGRSG